MTSTSTLIPMVSTPSQNRTVEQARISRSFVATNERDVQALTATESVRMTAFPIKESTETAGRSSALPCIGATSKIEIALVCLLRNQEKYETEPLRQRTPMVRRRIQGATSTPIKASLTSPNKPLRERYLRSRNKPCPIHHYGSVGPISKSNAAVSGSQSTVSMPKILTVPREHIATDISSPSIGAVGISHTCDSSTKNATRSNVQEVAA